MENAGKAGVGLNASAADFRPKLGRSSGLPADSDDRATKRPRVRAASACLDLRHH